MDVKFGLNSPRAKLEGKWPTPMVAMVRLVMAECRLLSGVGHLGDRQCNAVAEVILTIDTMSHTTEEAEMCPQEGLHAQGKYSLVLLGLTYGQVLLWSDWWLC